MQKSMVPRASLRLARGWVSPSAATGNPRGRGCQDGMFDRSLDFVPLQNQGDFFLLGSQAQSLLKTIKRGKTKSLPSNLKDSSTTWSACSASLVRGNGGAIDRQTPAQTRHRDHMRRQEEKRKTANALDSIHNQSAIGIYPREITTFVHTKTSIWIFVAALFTIVKAWKQPKCPSVWLNTLWSTWQHGILCSHQQGYIWIPATFWMDLKGNMLCKKKPKPPTKKLYTVWFYLYNILERTKS